MVIVMKKKNIQTFDDLLTLREGYKREAQKQMDSMQQRIKQCSLKKESGGHFRQITGCIEQVFAIYKGVTFGLRFIRRVRTVAQSFSRSRK